MKKVLFLTFLFVIFTSHSFAQSEDNKLCIEIPPPALFDFEDGCSFQMGSEIKLYRNLSLYVDGGGYLNINNGFYTTDGRKSDLEGYIVKGELKYYLNQDDISSGNYISLEGFYKKQSFNWQDSIHLTPAYLTTFHENKSVYCFNVKYGQLIVYNSRIVIDWYVGIGVRFKNATSNLTPQQESGLKYDDDSQYDSDQLGFTIAPGENIITPNIELGFKIGYRIL